MECHFRMSMWIHRFTIQTGCWCVPGKISGHFSGLMRINVKADPEWIDFWRKAYEAVIPGYHQNKKHWNTVILDGSVPDGEVKRMIAESYDLVR